jgi:hypothetical protein
MALVQETVCLYESLWYQEIEKMKFLENLKVELFASLSALVLNGISNECKKMDTNYTHMLVYKYCDANITRIQYKKINRTRIFDGLSYHKGKVIYPV